jgi:hypothetical protein
MSFAIIISSMLSLAVPLVWLAWLASHTPRSWLVRLLGLIGSAIFVVILAKLGAWWVLGWYTRWALLALALPLWCLAALRARSTPAWPRGCRGWATAFGAFAVAGLMATSIPELAGTSSARAVALENPLPPGTYQVAQGGDTESANHHLQVRAQRHALDIVRLNDAGFRARGLAPTRLADYAIYGTRLSAPCEGEVLVARDGLDDQPVGPPGDAGRAAPLGNAVLIHCTSDITVVLAHLQPHSLRVVAGDTVHVGSELGAVGNSGNTSEPHLHLHAVRGRVADPLLAITDAEPVRLGMGGQVFARNDRLIATGPETASSAL